MAARQKGSFSLGGTLEILADAPADARLCVKTKSELTDASSYPYKYVGMIVSVADEGKAYILTAADTTIASNWKELGEGGGGGGGGADLPSGGTTGQALTKKSNSDGDVEWSTINSIPNGGSTGQALAKKSNTDKDVEWIDVTNEQIQYVTMPTANASNEGKIVQFIGATTTTYTNGLFYECISDGAATPTYSWVQKDVQNYPEANLNNVFASGMPGVTTSKNINYSTDEQVVGTWIDGSTIYQKTLEIHTTTANTTVRTPIGAIIDKIIYAHGQWFWKNGCSTPLVFDNDGYLWCTDNTYDTPASGDPNSVMVLTKGANQLVYVTVQYTKIET